jgi:hypothetical protein
MQFSILSRSFAEKRFASADLVRYGGLKQGNACGNCGALLSSNVIAGPQVYELTAGVVGDFITDGMAVLVSERARDVLEKNKVYGFAVDETPVMLQKKTDQQYYYMIPNGVCTRLDENASGISVQRVVGCDVCRTMSLYSIERVVIDEASWAGHDIFECGSLTGEIIATSRLVALARMHNLANFNFISAEDFHYTYQN